MASSDEIFFKEFKAMMNDLKAVTGYINLTDIPFPPELAGRMTQTSKEMVAISPIQDEYYSRLGNTLGILWGKAPLMRRKFDYKGNFITDKDGNYIWKDVNCPSECAAVVSDISIGVPTSHKPAEHLEYVDMVTRKTETGEVQRKFVYLLPRKYLYKINQTALVISWNKLRVYYSGIMLSMQSGHTLYMYIIPYKPTHNTYHNYRVIMTKPSIEYAEELTLIRQFWVSNNIIFDPAECELLEPVRGIQNVACQQIDGVLDNYVMFDSNKPLGELDSLEDDIVTGEADTFE